MGGLFVKQHDGTSDKKCPICRTEKEDMGHMLVGCEENEVEVPKIIIEQVSPIDYAVCGPKGG